MSWEWSGRQTLALGLSQKAIKRNQSNGLTLTKTRDTTSQILFEACLSGRRFNEAIVTIENYSTDGDPHQALVLKLKTVAITAIGTKDNSGEEFFTLNFEKVETMSH
ncbi:MAG: type VI secretion system tube protein Hcp [Blastocatellia bacterium]|nr:type VI secretion system tube protein Hcp [Blastocatellia bacterium]